VLQILLISVTIECYVWGQVRNPGAYELSPSSNLIELISRAGGPTDYADLSRIKVLRHDKVYKINLKKFSRDAFFILEQGDVVIVPPNRTYKIKKYLENMMILISFLDILRFGLELYWRLYVAK